MIKALHLASFDGNIGDVANHTGFWNLFKLYITKEVSIRNLEIREFYNSWALRTFDESFAEMVNQYDLLVVGGGNFFDVRWDNSITGTTLNISSELLEQIKIPIVFNGLGIDYSPEICSEKAKLAFDSFIQQVNSRTDKYVVSVRNDDSKLVLDKFFNGNLLNNIIQIPDGCFFTTAREYSHPELPTDKMIISLNVAKDRMKERWGDLNNYNRYCSEFALFINKCVLEMPELHLVFIPHIPSDLQAIMDVLNGVKDCYCRRNVTIAPYLNGSVTPSDYLVDLYRKSCVTIGMRYHANICSIAMKTPTIGIVTLNKHIELYKNIGMDDRLFHVEKTPFCEELFEKLLLYIKNRDVFLEQNFKLVRKLEKESIPYYNKISKLL